MCRVQHGLRIENDQFQVRLKVLVGAVCIQIESRQSRQNVVWAVNLKQNVVRAVNLKHQQCCKSSIYTG